MTGVVDDDVETEEDASDKLLASSIVTALLLLRYRAGLRRQSSRPLEDLAVQIRSAIARADLASAPLRVRDQLANRLAADIGKSVDATYALILQTVQDELLALGITLAEAGVRQIEDAIGAGRLAVPPDKKRVSANVAASGIVGASLATWALYHRDSLTFQLRRIISDHARNGTAYNETQAALKGAIEAAQRAVAVTTNSAVTATAAVATEEVVRGNKGKILNGFIHLSVLDGRTSDLCRGRSGLKWLADGTPVGHDLPLRRPPLHPNCRSSLEPWIMDAADMPAVLRSKIDAAGRTGAVTGRVPKEPSLDEFLKSRPEFEQKRLLGEAQHALWKSGRITTSGLLDQSSRPLTLQQLRKALGLE